MKFWTSHILRKLKIKGAFSSYNLFMSSSRWDWRNTGDMKQIYAWFEVDLALDEDRRSVIYRQEDRATTLVRTWESFMCKYVRNCMLGNSVLILHTSIIQIDSKITSSFKESEHFNIWSGFQTKRRSSFHIYACVTSIGCPIQFLGIYLFSSSLIFLLLPFDLLFAALKD